MYISDFYKKHYMDFIYAHYSVQNLISNDFILGFYWKDILLRVMFTVVLNYKLFQHSISNYLTSNQLIHGYITLEDSLC